MKQKTLFVIACLIVGSVCLPAHVAWLPHESAALAADRPMRDTEINRGKRITKQASNQRILLTGPADLVIKQAQDPLVNSEIHLNHDQASVTFESLRPSQVMAMFTDEIQINGRPARDGSNARFLPVVNGTIITTTRRSTAPLQVFHERGYKGKAYEYQQDMHYNLLQLRQGNDRPASFILQPGYMCSLAEHTAAEGYTQTFVARDRELRVAGMPAGLRGKVSTIRVFPWRRTGKKGVHASVEQAELLGAQWYTTGVPEKAANRETLGASTVDAEYVPMIRSNRGEIQELSKRKGITHILLDDTPTVPGPPPAVLPSDTDADAEPSDDPTPGESAVEADPDEQAEKIDPAQIEKALDAWEPRPISGMRLAGPTLTQDNADWVYAFLAGARRRGIQVDFVPVQIDRPDWTMQERTDWLDRVHQRIDKPLWLTRFNHAAPAVDGTEPTPEQHAEHLIALCQALDKLRFVERYAVSIGDGAAAMIDSEGQLTPVGQAYHDHASVEAHTER